jgi:hypothetical protein
MCGGGKKKIVLVRKIHSVLEGKKYLRKKERKEVRRS